MMVRSKTREKNCILSNQMSEKHNLEELFHS